MCGDNSVLALSEVEWLLNVLLHQEEDYWKSRSKMFWQKEGDTNAKAFHSYANSKRQRNDFVKLKGEDGNWHEKGSGLEGVVQDIFWSSLKVKKGPLKLLLGVLVCEL